MTNALVSKLVAAISLERIYDLILKVNILVHYLPLTRYAKKMTRGNKNIDACTSIEISQSVADKPQKSMTASAKLNQSDFDLYVTKYITMSGLPFNHIDSDAFYSFIKQVAPKMKSKI